MEGESLSSHFSLLSIREYSQTGERSAKVAGGGNHRRRASTALLQEMSHNVPSGCQSHIEPEELEDRRSQHPRSRSLYPQTAPRRNNRCSCGGGRSGPDTRRAPRPGATQFHLWELALREAFALLHHIQEEPQQEPERSITPPPEPEVEINWGDARTSHVRACFILPATDIIRCRRATLPQRRRHHMTTWCFFQCGCACASFLRSGSVRHCFIPSIWREESV